MYTNVLKPDSGLQLEKAPGLQINGQIRVEMRDDLVMNIIYTLINLIVYKCTICITNDQKFEKK